VISHRSVICNGAILKERSPDPPNCNVPSFQIRIFSKPDLSFKNSQIPTSLYSHSVSSHGSLNKRLEAFVVFISNYVHLPLQWKSAVVG
jgi:hypothetical protein